MTISFNDTLVQDGKASLVDTYLSPLLYKGRTFKPFHVKSDGTKLYKKVSKTTSPWYITALKVASYATIILPLVALTAKYVSYRKITNVKIAPPVLIDFFRDLNRPTQTAIFDGFSTDLVEHIDSSVIERVKTQAVQGSKNACYTLSHLYDKYYGIEIDEEQSLHWLDKAAGYGHPAALMDRAYMHIHPGAYEHELKQAQEDFEAAAALGIEEASELLEVFFPDGNTPSNLLHRLLCGFLGEQDHDFIEVQEEDIPVFKKLFKSKNLFDFIEKSAKEESDPYAEYLRGVMFLHGVIYGKIENQAKQRFKASAEGDSPLGQYELGKLLLKEKDEDQIQQGVQLIEQAAEQNYCRAIVAAGHLFKEGNYVEPSYEKCSEYLFHGANLSYTPAISALGAFKIEVKDPQYRDIKDGIDLLKQCCNEMYLPALNYLGNCYLRGIPGALMPNLGKAQNLFTKAAACNDLDGLINLADSYLKQIPPNTNMAYKVYQKAKMIPGPRSTFAYTKFLFEHGKGKPDYNLAKHYLKALINEWYPDALFYRAEQMYDGWCSYKQKQEAFSYISDAALRGHIGALFYLADDPELDWEETMSYRTKAANCGFTPAQLYLAKYYLKEKDIEKGISYLELAADKGDPEIVYQAANVHLEIALETCTNKAKALEHVKKGVDYLCLYFRKKPHEVLSLHGIDQQVIHLKTLMFKYDFQVDDFEFSLVEE